MNTPFLVLPHHPHLSALAFSLLFNLAEGIDEDSSPAIFFGGQVDSCTVDFIDGDAGNPGEIRLTPSGVRKLFKEAGEHGDEILEEWGDSAEIPPPAVTGKFLHLAMLRRALVPLIAQLIKP